MTTEPWPENTQNEKHEQQTYLWYVGGDIFKDNRCASSGDQLLKEKLATLGREVIS